MNFKGFIVKLLEKEKSDICPYELLNQIKDFIDKNFEKEDYEKIIVLKNEEITLPYIISIGFYILKELTNKLNT